MEPLQEQVAEVLAQEEEAKTQIAQNLGRMCRIVERRSGSLGSGHNQG
jgi:hypothetical protein